MPPWDRNRRKRVAIGATASVFIITATALAVLYGPSLDTTRFWPPVSKVGGTVLDIEVPRDIGRMSERGTDDGQWCGAIGALSAPDHCYTFGGAGTVTDDVSNWDLNPAGAIRTGIVSGVPVESGGVADFTGELAAGLDGGMYYSAGSQTQSATNLISISMLVSYTDHGNNRLLVHDAGSGYGYAIRSQGATGNLRAEATGPDGASGFSSATPYGCGGWVCYTFVLDGRTASAGKLYVNGADVTPGTPDFSATGSWAGAGKFVVGARHTGGSSIKHALIARVRVDHAAVSLSDHAALCGTLWAPLRSNHDAYADTTWSQTGGPRCTDTATSRAMCAPPGAAAYQWSASLDATELDYNYLAEPGRVNRLPYAGDINCVDWTCVTATVADSVAPNGANSAGSITMGGGTVTSAAASGYGASAALHPRMWVKCSTGTLSVTHSGGNGDWDIACATIGGAWASLDATATAVTQNTAWEATAGGALTVQFAGADAEIWIPTFTEIAGYSVIPTWASAVDTGNATLQVVNAGGRYWVSSDTVLQYINTVNGTCMVFGATIDLIGASGTPCTAEVGGLKVDR